MIEDPKNGNKGSGIRPAAAELDPGILAELTRALLPYLGPYSITTVKRASRTTADVQEMIRVVAEQIDDLGKREFFVKSAKRILNDFRASNPHTPTPSLSPSPSPSQSPTTVGRAATPITSELMALGEVALAPIIGPLAHVLVQRYARASENSRDFFERLAGHLRSSEERALFFDNIRDAGRTIGA